MGISTPKDRKEFVKRLKESCNANPNVPPERMGRQAAIAQSIGVVPEAVSRWFSGETMPNNDRMRDLARYLGVEVGWLAMGLRASGSAQGGTVTGADEPSQHHGYGRA